MTVLVDRMLAWTAAEADLDRPLAELRTRFPSVVVWHGEYTGQWWALARDYAGRDMLIERDNPAELGRQLEVVRSRSHRNADGRIPTSRLISSTIFGWPPDSVTASTPSVIRVADLVEQESPATRCGGRHKKSSKRRFLGRVIGLLVVRHATEPDNDHQRHLAGRAAVQMELVR